ncbi:MAG TPA: hypothetical protein PKC67_05415 [Kiritimatiellia bacterium]|nr:hypothetical protein [Kiritimatiellia bacterium]HMP33772.1 hypothetical protein [Kiritimatiellia bacterium]
MGKSFTFALMTSRIKQAAKRFFTLPDVHYWALTDDIATILSWLSQWKHPPPPNQERRSIQRKMAWRFNYPETGLSHL